MSSYIEFHAKRYTYLIKLLKQLLPNRNALILDIGRSPLTLLIWKEYPNVVTLDFEQSKIHLDKIMPIPETVPHIVFDLNDTKNYTKWIELPKFDCIVFAEVLEHLYVAPEYVFEFLKSGLKPGGFLVCQTPNAVAIGKRLRMLMGQNPYERIRTGNDPGHFREYTKKELIELGNKLGLVVVMHQFKNYFATRKCSSKLLYTITSAVPSFRQGQTIVYRDRE